LYVRRYRLAGWNPYARRKLRTPELVELLDRFEDFGGRDVRHRHA